MEIENLPAITESVAIIKKATRGTSNKNVNGNSEDRRRRKNYLLETYAANTRLIRVEWEGGDVEYRDAEAYHFEGVFGVVSVAEVPTTRCYRCGDLLHFETLTVDRIVPGCKKTAKYPNGGTYIRENIRPCCGPCNSETGGAMSNGKEHQAAKKRRVRS